MPGGDAQVLEQAVRWLREGRPTALATVVGTWGSAPRPLASRMAITADGRFAGSVSGGCVEGAVIEEAGAVLAARRARLLEYGVSDERAWSLGLTCGGRLAVYLEPLLEPHQVGLLERLLAAHAERRTVRWVCDTGSGASVLLGEDGTPLAGSPEGRLAGALGAARSASGSGMLAGEQAGIWVEVRVPPLRLLVVGAVHVAQHLATMAVACGWEVVVIDPRAVFASPERFPEVERVIEWPGRALERLAPDRRSAVAVLSHDPKLDDPALRVALASPVPYVGALGSRRTHARRLARLREAGLGEHALARIRAPIGLDIGARGAAEIALAVLAEITAVMHRGDRGGWGPGGMGAGRGMGAGLEW